MRRMVTVLAFSSCMLLAGARDAETMPRLLADGRDGGGGPFINLIVREIRVDPIRARVGDAVRVELIVENRGDPFYDTTSAEILANGRVVSTRRVTFGSSEGDRIRRESFIWDTRGAAPGEYRIRGEVFLWYDGSEFDNFLDLAVPLTLLPAQSPSAAAAEPGGSAVTTDPRWRPGRTGGMESPSSSPGGY